MICSVLAPSQVVGLGISEPSAVERWNFPLHFMSSLVNGHYSWPRLDLSTSRMGLLIFHMFSGQILATPHTPKVANCGREMGFPCHSFREIAVGERSSYLDPRYLSASLLLGLWKKWNPKTKRLSTFFQRLKPISFWRRSGSRYLSLLKKAYLLRGKTGEITRC